MELKTTKVFDKTLDAFIDPNIRLIISYGGTSSSKSISIYQLLFLYAIKNPNKTIAIIGESYPVIKRNIIKDLKNVVMKGFWSNSNFNKQDFIYKFPNGSTFQFLSANNPDSFRGYRSDVAYFDEISNIPKESYDQITMRCKYKILASFNPSHEFYIVDEMSRSDAKVIKSTYLDNQFLDAGIISELLMKAELSKRFRDVYLNGNFGVGDGIIFENDTNWIISEEWPDNYKWRIFGLDFGFTNDPSVLVEVRYYNKELWIKEHFYKTHLLTNDIIAYLKVNNLKNETINADNSEPREIETIRLQGFHIKGVKYNIMSSIQRLQDIKMNIYYESNNLIKEYRNYSYVKDKVTGKFINKPIDVFNHGIDAIRYAVSEKLMRASSGNMRIVQI